MRCTHGSRDCTWPEGVPTRKKSAARKDSLDERPSTAGSSGLSEASTPPTREHTPPRRHQSELNLVPLPSRSSSESFVGMDPVASEHDSGRRPIERASSYSHSHSSSNTLSMIPESAYSPRYDYLGSATNQSSRHNMSAPYRPLSYQPPSHWTAPPEPMDPYYHGHYNGGIQDRPLVGHNSPNDHSHNRYQ
ncbi:hypothetical protein NLJ89_g10362 [Agrocybe chaxingu]|uniref:Uncharacterized protein n=1 Tax=Agrocybe chaxingu TaxID=84603 RepID=A0A9W8JRX2_9AGAR|nr:hypothetical protein NLJ89_g10362 [Agrocybe chaxingu]